MSKTNPSPDDIKNILDDLDASVPATDTGPEQDPFLASIVRKPREMRMADDTLRPTRLDDVIGQDVVKSGLRRAMDSALRLNRPLDHVFLQGPPGIGKTTIASVIANEMNMGLIMDTGPTLTKERMLNHITNIQNTAVDEDDPNGEEMPIVLFVDEAHGIPKETHILLLPLLEDFRFTSYHVPMFTFVAATTEAAKIPQPLRDRLPLNYILDYYNVDSLLTILRRSFRILWGYSIEEAERIVGVGTEGERALKAIAQRAKGVPRLANHLLRRVQETAVMMIPEDKFQTLKGSDQFRITREAPFDMDVVRSCMMENKIDRWGLTPSDRRVIDVMLRRYGGRPIGPQRLASAIGENVTTVTNVIEPSLHRLGLVERGERGRYLSELGLRVASLSLANVIDYGFDDEEDETLDGTAD